MYQEYRKNDIVISTDKTRLNPRVIQAILKQSYWGDYVPHEIVQMAIDNSICFGMYQKHEQIGFARVVTDFSTIAYIADLVILEAYKTDELMEWMLECVQTHPKLAPLRKWLTASKKGVYAHYELESITAPEQMEDSQEASGK